MHTRKQKEEERNTKLQLINMVSTLNLLAFLVNSLHNVYKNYSLPMVRLLCCAILVESDKGYFYKKDLYTMLPYSLKSFQNTFNKHKDCFAVVKEEYNNRTRYKLSLIGSTTLQEFYSIFIQQLSTSI